MPLSANQERGRRMPGLPEMHGGDEPAFGHPVHRLLIPDDAVWVVEPTDYVPPEPPLRTPVFDDPDRLNRTISRMVGLGKVIASALRAEAKRDAYDESRSSPPDVPSGEDRLFLERLLEHVEASKTQGVSGDVATEARDNKSTRNRAGDVERSSLGRHIRRLAAWILRLGRAPSSSELSVAGVRPSVVSGGVPTD